MMMKDSNTVSILGCGWLGLPLAERLVKRGCRVLGSTTQEEKLPLLQGKGIEAGILTLGDDFDSEAAYDLLQSEVLFLNIPPGRGRGNVRDDHTLEMEALLECIEASPVSHVIFASSTSVYRSTYGIVTELSDEEPDKDSGQALREIEKWFLNSPHFSTTVLRFAGLLGGNRHPAKNLSGKTGLQGGNTPVNLVHRSDCLTVIEHLILHPQENEIFNVVCDEHPTREEFYTAQCLAAGIAPPQFDQEHRDAPYKIVSNEKLKRTLNYQFRYPDPATMPFDEEE